MQIRMYACGAIISIAGILFSCSSETDLSLPEPIITPNDYVMSTFEDKYPDAKDIVWNVNSIYYVADFNLNSTKMYAWFNEEGEWMLSETYASSSRIPQCVNESFGHSYYFDYKVKTKNVLERKDIETIYIIEVESELDHTNLYYTEFGTLIKTVGNAKEYVDKPVTIDKKVIALINNMYIEPKIVDSWNDALGIKICINDNEGYKVVALDNNMSWICTILDMDDSSVPPLILESFQNSDYGKFPIGSIKQMINAEDYFYLIYFKTEKKNAVATLKKNGSFKSVLHY